MNFKLMAAGVAVLFTLSAAARAETIVVQGDADIFAAGLSSAPGSVSGGGSLPPSVSVIAGSLLDITATGSINCCDTAGSPGVSGPDGFATNPFGGSGSTITNSTGSTVSDFSSNESFPLVATFANASGAVGHVFVVGSSDSNVLVPMGATALYFGLADAAGFNGPSGYYADNNGSFNVTVSAAPEPSTWALMIAGLGGVGLVLRRRKSSDVGFANAVAG